jgi:biopolymer transport protein ExbD
MKAPRRARSGGLGFNMTPMIDITFQLVIFFLVASHWSRQEVGVAVNLPTAHTGREEADDESPRVTINVLADGRMLLGGQSIGREELAARLRVENAQHDGRLEVRLRTDRQTAFALVEPVLKTCADAGIAQAKFAVIRAADRRD